MLKSQKNHFVSFYVGFVSLGFFAHGGAFATCLEQAAAEHRVDPLLLKAIAWTESRGRAGAVGPTLKDGNKAIGVMQINTIHLPALPGVTENDLRDACTSFRLGAWVLRDCINKFGATWKAVGCYNTGPASKNLDAQRRYVDLVEANYRKYQEAAARAVVTFTQSQKGETTK